MGWCHILGQSGVLGWSQGYAQVCDGVHTQTRHCASATAHGDKETYPRIPCALPRFTFSLQGEIQLFLPSWPCPPSLDLVLEGKSENLGESLNGKAQLVLKSQIHLEIAFWKQVPGRAHAEERAAWRPPEGALGCLNLNN